MPPLIDIETAAAIDAQTASAETAVSAMSFGNFIIQLLLNGSLSQLFGMIRAMQFIVLSFLIRIPTPATTFRFFQGCATIAQMDVFDGSTLYATLFTFTDSNALNDSFLMLGICDKNFLLNSGSYFIIMSIIVGTNIFNWLANSIAKKCSKFRVCRRIGMGRYAESYRKECKA